MSSVLSQYPNILERITEKYGEAVTRVCHYYDLKKSEVQICDVSPYIGRDV